MATPASAAAAASSSATPSAPSSFLNAARLSERIGTIVEQPPFVTGAGGVASTDRDSYAHARALLTLVAFQAYPVLVRRFPQLRVWSLLESHHDDGTSGVAGHANVRVRFVEAGQGREGMEVSLAGGAALVTAEALAAPGGGGGGGGASSSSASASPPASLPLTWVRIEIPCRSRLTGKLLEFVDVRRFMWRALAQGAASKAGLSEAQASEEVEALEREYRDKYFASAPQDVTHLVWMGVMNRDYVAEHDAFVAAVAQPKAEKGSLQRGLSDVHGVHRTDHRSSAVGLWWPAREGSITFAEMQRQRAALKEAVAVAKVAEAEEKRLLQMRAAEKRMSGGGSSS